MHGETVKFVGAQQAKLYNTYKNTKLKLLKTNAAVPNFKISDFNKEHTSSLKMIRMMIETCWSVFKCFKKTF